VVAWSKWRAAVSIRPLSTQTGPAKLSLNVLIVTAVSSVLFALKDLQNRGSYLVCCLAHKCHTCCWL
jgi:hypothetical protein